MKLKVKSTSDLKRLALESGGEAQFSGGKFNTSMERGKIEKSNQKVETDQAPRVTEEKPEAVSNDAIHQPVTHQESINITLDMDPVAKAIDAGNREICKVVSDVIRDVRVQAATQSPASWTFTVKRDVRGFIQSIEAKQNS